MSSVEKAKALYGAFATGDVPTVLAGMDPGIRWSEAEGTPYQPSGAAWVGPQAIVDNLFMKLATEWENFSLHPATFYDAGDSAVVEGRYTGKYLPTGAELDSQYCHVFTFAGDKLVRFQQYTDTAQYQKVFGQ
jgi:ketosteroid isomerase-like protein